MAKTILADTGYWIALFDPRDQFHTQAKPKANYLETFSVLFPWPIIYETLGTRFVKNQLGMAGFERVLKRRNVLFANDGFYREAALERTLQESRRGASAISLCDMMIRLILQDKKLRIDGLLTFNQKDFSDVCRTTKTEIL
jgi:predicted nucleic acid-binding protein